MTSNKEVILELLNLVNRRNMTGFDRTVLGGDISIVSRVYAKYPLAVLLNMADMLATYVQ